MADAAVESPVSAGEHPREFERLWRGFMTARATLGLVLLVLQGSILLLSPQPMGLPFLICLAYFAITLTLRLTGKPQHLASRFDAQWLRTVGVDVFTFGVLQVIQGHSINYTPLLALPVLVVSILGTPLHAMASAAGITLLLLGLAVWAWVQTAGDFASFLLQAALTGAGCFAISFIASQMATRLASVELRARRSQLAAAVQQEVNQLVIDSLSEGILVVTRSGVVPLANPAALALLGAANPNDLDLRRHPAWQTLLNFVATSFERPPSRPVRVDIDHPGQPVRQLLVRAQLTHTQDIDAQDLCVVFMQDQRELEARIRSEKLVSMGRMSAAVAHEIRNPLAAITQANALLSEDLNDPAQQRLAQMVQQNARRLDSIVQDVLHLVRVPGPSSPDPHIELNETVQRIGRDWSSQNHCEDVLTLTPARQPVHVPFDSEHMRRVLLNLLDNALRYASAQPGSIQIAVEPPHPSGQASAARVTVWSDGAALEPTVERHLFEPFFSSESRSSGLGLYICRELCESHQATIGYARNQRPVAGHPVSGNEFSVRFGPVASQPTQP